MNAPRCSKKKEARLKVGRQEKKKGNTYRINKAIFEST